MNLENTFENKQYDFHTQTVFLEKLLKRMDKLEKELTKGERKLTELKLGSCKRIIERNEIENLRI